MPTDSQIKVADSRPLDSHTREEQKPSERIQEIVDDLTKQFIRVKGEKTLWLMEDTIHCRAIELYLDEQAIKATKTGEER